MPIHYAPSATTLILFALFIQSTAFGQDNYINTWKSKIILDRSNELDLTTRRKTVIIIPVGAPGVGDATEWKQLLHMGNRALEKSRGAEFSLTFQSASTSEGPCVEEGKLTGDCATAATQVAAGGNDLIVLLHGFQTDSAGGATFFQGAAPVGSGSALDGMGGLTGGFRQSNPVLHMIADFVVAEATTGKVLYHARHTTDGTSTQDMRNEFANQLVAQLAKLFDPMHKQNFRRNVLSLHPIGLGLTAANFGMYQVTYERLLGEGQSSLYWNPVFAINNEDSDTEEHHIHYLLLPLAGIRYYFRNEGHGLWIGGKAGYSYFEFISKGLEGSFNNDCKWTKAHMGFLAGELGTSRQLGRLRLHASGTIGLGLGWKKSIERDSFSSEEATDDRGFGVLPVFDLSTGLGWAF